MLAYKDKTNSDKSDPKGFLDLFVVKAQIQLKTQEQPIDLFKESIDRVFSPFNNLSTNNDSLKNMLSIIVNKWGEAQYNSIEGLNKGKICNNCKEEPISQIEELTSEIQKLHKIKEGQIAQIKLLEKENDKMAHTIKHSLPTHSIAFACATSFGFAGFLILYLLQLLMGLYLVHPFISFSGMIGSGGLLLTALLSMKDWKEWICKNDKK